MNSNAKTSFFGSNSNYSKMIFMLLLSVHLVGCKTVEPILYSDNNDARRLYTIGEKYLNNGLYDLAIGEFKKSISIDNSPLLPHTKLAVAYYAKKDYLNSALAFKAASDSSGGANNAGPLPIMEVLSLMRAGKKIKAENLLIDLTGPEVVVSPTGSYSAKSGRAYGVWKDAANYLLSRMDENSYLSKVPKSDMSFPYLIIGTKAAIDKEDEKAINYLSKAVVSSGRGTWRGIMAMEELIPLKKVSGN